MEALFLSNDSPASRSQIEPFYSYRRELSERHDFRFVERMLNHLDDFELEELNRFDVVFVQSRFFRGQHALLNMLLRGMTVQKVILDDEASTTRCVFGAVPLVDLYVKKHVLRYFEGYRYQYKAERIHASLVDELEGEGTREPLDIPDEFRARLYAGWNIGTTKGLRALLDRCDADAARTDERRPIDISMRLSVDIQARSHWFCRHRQRALESVTALNDSFQVLASKQTVPWRQYNQELCASKMCLSPWGYGEICYRDFEVIMAGALLIKPPMDHVVTNPDIYQPGETYVQVRTDFSDLREVCAYYLARKEERRRITQAALATYKAYFHEHTFLRQMGEILARLRGERSGTVPGRGSKQGDPG